jgi:TonB family protein
VVKLAHLLLGGCLVILALSLVGWAQQTGSKDSHPAGKQLTVHLPPEEAHSRLVYSTVPKYPENARRGRIEGPIALRVYVNTDGSVGKMTPLNGNPFLLIAAMDAVKNWRYRPYLLNGAPVQFESVVTVKFTLL